MSTDLLLNIEKSTSKKTTSGSASANKTEVNDKKSGQSLFDSLLSQAKQETAGTKKEENSSDKKTQKSSENKTENQLNNKTQTTADSKIEAQLDTKTKNIIEKTSNPIHDKKIETSDEIKNNQSLQKMVDKLVDIVVTTAKDILNKNSEKVATTDSELNNVVKNTVEEVVQNKLADVSDKEKVKILINDKLEIIKSSVDIIKSEMQNKPTLSDNKNISEDTQKNLTSKSEIPSAVNTKELDTVIDTEVKTIKENIQEIKKEVLNIVSDNSNKNDEKESRNQNRVEVKDDKSALVEIKKEVSNILASVVDKSETDESINKVLVEEISTSLKTIDESSDDIKSEVSKLPSENKIESAKSVTTQEVKVIHNKVDVHIDQIEKEVTKVQEKVSEIIIVKTTDDKITQSTTQATTKINLSNIATDISSKLINSDEKSLLAAMFLNTQKNTKEKTSLEQIHDAKSNIIDKKTLESVKVSAEKLDLGLNKTEIKNEGNADQKSVPQEVKKDDAKVNNLFNSRDLNRAFLDQRIEANNVINQRNQQVIQQQEQVSIVEESKKAVDAVEITVPKEVVQTLQTKIIGAQQKMGSFMSEVARNMYLNYKPPVTAFRVNLNPANLGSISIIMKANKVDNSLSVSMNLSNSNTMEAFTENKVALQNAIQRQFTETSNVSINFNMQDQSSQDNFNQSNQDGKQEKHNNNNSESNSENIEEQEIIEHNDYM